MTLAELVIGIENGKLVRREPSEEEIHERFEYFRERNHLVEEVLEGKTTFSKALRSSKSWVKRLVPFAGKSEDFRNLEYLLAVPFAYEEEDILKKTPISIPQDYYERPLHFPLRDSDPPVRMMNGLVQVAKYIGPPFINGIITGTIAGFISDDAVAPVGYGTMALTAAGLAVWDIYRKVTLPGGMTIRAKMLDKVVADVFNPSTSIGSRDKYERRHTLATQWSDSADSYYRQEDYERAIDFTLRAVKAEPLNFGVREFLINIYTMTNDPRCFDELREARIVFGSKVDGLDMKASMVYGQRNNVDGYQKKLLNSAMLRDGIGTAISLKNSMEKRMQT